MARRSDHSKEELKELSILHAYELVEEKGEAGFKARDIAKRMGYTVGTIYYIFGNMENLRFHVYGAILDLFHEEIAKGISNKRNKLNYHIKKYVQFSQDYQNLWLFLYGLDDMTQNDIPDWYLDKIHRFFCMIVEALLPHIKQKRKAPKAAQTILTSIHGMCILSIRGNRVRDGEFNLEAMAKHMITTYLYGLNNS
ncbi:MAG: TetR/AcrR family transcriptional regulator [Gammaproteobacteria bacterium]|jgi:AcrR family transcriptional regulator|nr:TetR/AcrR family transcriptional regulator [Gammaproteobacteria bacterium]